MRIVLITFLLISTIGFSQDVLTKEIGSFKELKVFSGLTVQLEKSDTPRIEISGKKRDEVVVKNINGRLKLSMRFPETFNAYEADIKLYYSDNLLLVDANEGAIIASDNDIEQKSIELRVQEGAVINMPLKVSYLIGKAVSGGQLNVSGELESQDLELTTGGIFDGYDLEANQTYITSSSGAVGKIFVNEMLDVKVSLGGSVYYKGNPTDVISKKIIGGTIKSKD
ncbi:head GIN domain-containing protein [Urechidicola vernalis]|uniref:Head GIN domain-containing protein n=1 Tax=Urechidicola vernalis TaxID=3075600 RepID=A0ABU2Y5Z0_9FLAO|nr:head GIN domain-containing protein [Urechidicola sp. P050]MDT0553626.1 head GIN domain-containing protein [Urechidicola sp. P050]